MKDIDEPDFTATYNPVTNSWTAAWKWSEGKEPGVLQNKVEVYDVPHEARELYEEELGNWIEEGWLLP